MFLLPAPFAHVFDPDRDAELRRPRGRRGDAVVRRPGRRPVGERF